MTLQQPDTNGHLLEVNSSLHIAIICHNIRDTEHIVSHACWRYRSGDLSAAKQRRYHHRPRLTAVDVASSRLLSAGGRFPFILSARSAEYEENAGRSRLWPTSSRLSKRLQSIPTNGRQIR